MFKPFFVHLNVNRKFGVMKKHPRGATLYVTPVENEYRSCNIQATWCANADHYCKKTGRELALKSDAIKINKRDLTRIIARIAQECRILTGDEVNGYTQPQPQDWEYLNKYMF